MKKFISWIVGVGILTGIGSAFTSAFSLGDGRCDDCVCPEFSFFWDTRDKVDMRK